MTSPGTMRPERLAAADIPPAEFVPDLDTLQSDTADPAAQEQAFGEIVEVFQAPLTRFVARMIGPNDAEDMVQDTFIRIFQKIGSFEETAPGGFRQWVYQITRHGTLNAIRDSKRDALDQSVSDGLEPRGAGTSANRIGIPEAQVEFRDDIARLREGIAPTQFELLVQGEGGDDRSLEEMAASQGISVQSVKSRMWRGRQSAKRILDES